MKNKQQWSAEDKTVQKKVRSSVRHRKVRCKRLAVGFTVAAGVLIFLLSACYLGLSMYYRNGFAYGTWINGIYCTGKTVQEVNAQLLETWSYEGLTVYDRQGKAYRITAEEIGFSFDFKEALEKYLQQQKPYRWIDQLFKAKEHNLIPRAVYNEEQLAQAVLKIPEMADRTPDEMRRVYIRRSIAGYELVNERAEVLNRSKAQEAVIQAVCSGEMVLDLVQAGCYEQLAYTPVMKKTLAEWEKINRFQDCRIVYRMGEELLELDASVVCDWIALDEDGKIRWDEDGNLIPDDEKIEAFIDSLADEYDTVGAVRQFRTTRGELITIEGGTYGNRMNREAEKEYLKQAFRDQADEVHTPEYLQMGMKQGQDDIGNTYIEVDMTEQMMYYYEEGRLVLETPVVTGNTGRRMGTPVGVNYVYGKQKNRILRGPGYASHVNFWMPVKGNIGIHDASWRSDFGGEIYKTGGSHGCINTPYEAMEKLYEMVSVGTPVVMFY